VNAADAVCPGGRVWVRVEARAMSESALAAVHTSYASAGPFAVVEVTDDGHGMDAETLARIFEPFFTTKDSGHGLGLAAVVGLIRAHHGFVAVDSTPGAGTRFVLGLPAAGDTDRAARQRVQTEPAPGRTGGGRLALVVDDEEVVTRVLRRLLRAEGFRVEVRTEGDGFLEAVAALDPALVVLDVTLPRHSGLELLQRLRAQGDPRPVLVSSGHVGASERLVLDPSERTGFLAKPYGVAQQQEPLARLLG